MERSTEDRKGWHPLLTAAAWTASGYTTLLCGLAVAGIYVYYRFQGDEAYGNWFTFLMETPTGLLLLLVLALNILTGGWRAAIRCRQLPSFTASYVQSLDISATFPEPDAPWTGALSHWLTLKGYQPVLAGEKGYSIRGQWSFLPQVTLRFGILLLLFGLFLSHHARLEDRTVLGPGETGQLLGDPVRLVELRANLPETHLQVGREKNFSIQGITAELEDSRGPLTVTQGWPVKSGSRYYAITGVGFAQTFLRAEASAASQAVRVNLDVLPPGKEDKVLLFGDTVQVSLYPEKTVSKGRLSGELFNIAQPSYLLEQTETEGVVVSISPAGQEDSGGALQGSQTAYWARIRAVRDPGLILIHGSLSLIGAGLLLLATNFFWYRREVVFIRGEREIVVGYREQYLKKWGIQRFYRWKEELSMILETPGHVPDEQAGGPEARGEEK